MNFIEYIEELLKVIDEMPENTKEQWEWTFQKAQNDEELLDGYKETLRKTREYYKNLPEKIEVQEVRLKVEDSVICITGISPLSGIRAKYLTMVQPAIIKLLLEQVKDNYANNKS